MRTTILSKLENVTYVGDGLFLSKNYDFCKVYKGNRFVKNLSNTKLIHSETEEKDAERKYKTILSYLKIFAKERPEYGKEYLFDANMPIIIAKINKDYIIVDGQNRFAVCRDLQIPYYFRVLQEIDNEKQLMSYIKRFNYNRNSWTKTQQIGSLARLGNKYAQIIVNFAEKYKVPELSIMYFAVGKSSHKTSINFDIPSFDVTKTERILELIHHVAMLTSDGNEKNALLLKKHNRFTNFITFMFENNLASDLISKASKIKVKKISGASSIDAYLNAFGFFDISSKKKTNKTYI